MTSRAIHLTFLSLALFFFAFAISVFKPGLPSTLKADEPAYFLMALSLIEDGDLRAEAPDYERLNDTYPHLPAENLILMSDDRWQTVYFGKPYLYPLLTTPLAALWGANGMVALNALLFAAMLWMGAVYLARFNPEPVAILLSLAFFFLSPTFAYVFWLQPELLNMAAVMAALFLVFHRFELAGDAGGPLKRLWRRVFNDATRPAWSGALLAIGGYNKPVLAIVAVPIFYVLWTRSARGRWRRVLQWSAASLLAMAALAAGSVALTGHPTAYLGMARSGVKVESAEAMDEVIGEIEVQLEELSTTANSWSWMFDAPPFTWLAFFERLGYFFWGRHTGILLYTPFTVFALLWLLANRRRDVGRWLLLGSLVALGLFFVVKIPLNWHGGAGFVGNRYLINVYPMLLFMITAARPLWLLPAASAVGGLFLGTVIFTPFGAPVPQPTLQAHARSLPFRHFPLELSLRRAIPGYTTVPFHDLTIIGRRDLFKDHQPELGNMWLHGGVETELYVLSGEPRTGLFFEIRTWAPDNVVELDLAGDRRRVEFVDAVRERQRTRMVELTPQRKPRKTWEIEYQKPILVYDFSVRVEEGERIIDAKDPHEIFYLGAQLKYVGRREQITAPEHYRIHWLAASAPAAVGAGEIFEVEVEARNDCMFPISPTGPLAVRLSSHWIAPATGERVHGDKGGRRTDLAVEVQPGEVFTRNVTVRAPATPGDYVLQLDAVRESIAWFSERGGETREIPITVLPSTDR